MTVNKEDLPPYPNGAGASVATQLRAAQARYRKRLADLESELEKTEQAFAEAFERADAARAVKNRISDLASNARRKRSRNI